MLNRAFIIKATGVITAVLVATAGILILQNHTANRSSFFDAQYNPTEKATTANKNALTTATTAAATAVPSTTESPTQAEPSSVKEIMPPTENSETGESSMIDITSQITSMTDGENTANSDYDSSLQQQLAGTGYDSENFDFSQLIIIDTKNTNADVSLFDKDKNGKWQEVIGGAWANIGRNGATSAKSEGDGCTPMGLYSIGDAFYIDNKPHTGLNTFQITPNTYWVDDPASLFYNQRVEGTDNKDWSSAEHMADYKQDYKYGFVINYNSSPVIAGAGSAIFVHSGSSPTSGCVAIGEDDLLDIMLILDKSLDPHILII